MYSFKVGPSTNDKPKEESEEEGIAGALMKALKAREAALRPGSKISKLIFCDFEKPFHNSNVKSFLQASDFILSLSCVYSVFAFYLYF